MMASQKYPSKANPLTSPPFPAAVFSVTQCAKYTAEEYIVTLCREQHRTRKQIEEIYKVFGGVEGFLRNARRKKAHLEETVRDLNTVVLWSKPQASERTVTTSFPEWGIAMCVWGFEKMAYTQCFSFIFVNLEGEHIKTPAGLTITTVNYVPGARVHSVQASISQSFYGTFGQAEEEMGLQTYMILEGTILKINYQNTDVYVHIPFHNLSSIYR